MPTNIDDIEDLRLKLSWHRANMFYEALAFVGGFERLNELLPKTHIFAVTLHKDHQLVKGEIDEYIVDLYEPLEKQFCQELIEIYNVIGGDGTYTKSIMPEEIDYFYFRKNTERDFGINNQLRPEKFKFLKHTDPNMLLIANYNFWDTDDILYFQIDINSFEVVDCGRVSELEQTLLASCRD